MKLTDAQQAYRQKCTYELHSRRLVNTPLGKRWLDCKCDSCMAHKKRLMIDVTPSD